MDADGGRMGVGKPGDRSRDRRGALAVFLLGVGLAWSAGNVGPVVGELRDEFDISLTAVGVLSGGLAVALAGALAFAVATIPLLGTVLNAGDGREGFLALAAFVALAGLLNLRPVSGTVAGAAAGPEADR